MIVMAGPEISNHDDMVGKVVINDDTVQVALAGATVNDYDDGVQLVIDNDDLACLTFSKEAARLVEILLWQIIV
jgi:hypothetical protein